MVNRLKSYLLSRRPCPIRTVNENQVPGIDNLYVDMNYVLYLSVSSLPEGIDNLIENVIINLLRHLEVICTVLCPQKLLFISMDGVLPWARVVYRQRSDWQKHLKWGPEFTQNQRYSAKAGSEFSVEVQKRLEEFIVHKVSTDRAWMGIDVVLSGHKVPGQGDTKIIQYIKWLQGGKEWVPNTRHCVFGNNYDYVLFGLALHEPYFLLAERSEECSYNLPAPEEMVFSICYLSLLRGLIELDLASIKDKIPFELNIENFIDDWIFQFSLQGTDCLPPMRKFSNDFLAAYTCALPRMKGYINDRGVLNLGRLGILLKELHQLDCNSKGRCVTNSSGRDQQTMVKDYVKGLQYFFYKIYGVIPSWSWYYPHLSAPPVDAFQNLDSISINFEMDNPPDIFVPLTAFGMNLGPFFAPSAFRSLVTSDASPVRRYLPQKLKSITDIKKTPFMDKNILYSAMKPYYKNLTEEEQRRRTVEPILIFDLVCSEPGQDRVRMRRLAYDELLQDIRLVKGTLPEGMQNVHIGYPFIRSTEKINHSDILKRSYVLTSWPELVLVKPFSFIDENLQTRWDRTASHHRSTKDQRFPAKTKQLLAFPFLGYKPNFTSPGLVCFEQEWNPVSYPFEAENDCIPNIPPAPPSITLQDYIPVKSQVFLVTEQYYGCIAEVLSVNGSNKVEVTVRKYTHPGRIRRNFLRANAPRETRKLCERLELDEIQHLQRHISSFLETVSKTNVTAHPKYLYKPIDGLDVGPDPHATHEILDRVVSVRSNYLVPLGSRGSIIGKQKSGPPCFWVYDILFDNFVKRGQNKIVRMSSRAFLNFDYGKTLSSKPATHGYAHQKNPRSSPALARYGSWRS